MPCLNKILLLLRERFHVVLFLQARSSWIYFTFICLAMFACIYKANRTFSLCSRQVGWFSCCRSLLWSVEMSDLLCSTQYYSCSRKGKKPFHGRTSELQYRELHRENQSSVLICKVCLVQIQRCANENVWGKLRIMQVKV